MTLFVVDASVAAKWLLAEEHSAEAKLLIAPQHQLIAPELMLVEVANTLLKKVRRHELPADQARAARDVPARSVRLVPSASLAEPAFELAIEFARSIYDSLYLTLAVVTNSPLVTADRRLFNSLVGTRLATNILWIGDMRDAQSD